MKTIPSSLVAEYFAKLVGGKVGEFIIEQQVAMLEHEEYRKACYEWLEKTEWVQETIKPNELGMHRADILRKRIEDLEREVLLLKLK